MIDAEVHGFVTLGTYGFEYSQGEASRPRDGSIWRLHDTAPINLYLWRIEMRTITP